jgi:stage II sporulation protein D (peptidoglycan lytic transglycosylase)
MSFLAVPLLILFAALPVNSSYKVQIGLFTLFRPHSMQLRIAAGDNAILDAASFTSTRIGPDQIISVSIVSNRLKVDVQGSHGIRQFAITDSARITPDESATLELILPGKIKRVVRGAVSIDCGKSGRGPLRIVLTTASESAVASIVAAETSEREPQALMALAVVVRTFMLSHPGRHTSEGFDFCDTTHCQLYRGEHDLSDRIAEKAIVAAVSRTSGKDLRFEGALLEGYYTAACGGLTATPSMVWGGRSRYPYARISCEWCQTSKFKTWERSADRNRILDSLSEFTDSRLSSAAELIADTEQPGGFVRTVTVHDGSTRIVLTSDTFRRAIGLHLGWSTVLSPSFTIARHGSRYVFKGRGFGSQVGLCVTGAMAQARAGRGYREILSFYYPAAVISEATPE